MALFVFSPKRFLDERGWFSETFSARVFSWHVPAVTFVQDNRSLSRNAGTVRGLHFQSPPHAQAKLISCPRGAIFDVAVDLRVGSPTFGQHCSIELSAENGRQIFIPVGFAHGLMTLTPDTEVEYKVSDFYAPASEHGLAHNDPALEIAWPTTGRDTHLSPKDAILPSLAQLASPFAYDGIPMTLTEVS